MPVMTRVPPTIAIALTLSFAAPMGASAQSTLLHIGDAGSGATTSRVSLATLFDTRFVTATVAGNASIEITSWDVSREGHFTKDQSATENGASNELALMNLGSAAVAAAFVAQNGNLRLVSWSVGPTGAVRRTGAIGAGAAARVSAAAVGAHRIVTATQDGAGVAKLIVWDVDAAGAFARRGDVAGTSGSTVAISVLSPGLVATAVRNASGKLEVATYSLDATGKIAALGSVEGDAVTEVAMAATALDRVVTAARMADGSVEIGAWTAPAGGKLALSGTAKAASAASLAVSVFSGVKALIAGLKPDGTLTLTSWQVSDGPTELDSIGGGPGIGAALTTVGWDRAVTAVIGRDGVLKLTTWGDRAVGLLHTTWDAKSPLTSACGIRPPRRAAQADEPADLGLEASTVVAEESAGNHDDDDDDEEAQPKNRRGTRTPERSDLRLATQVIRGGGYSGTARIELAQAPTPTPAPALMFEPVIQGVDPMVAVGEQYVLVSEHGSLEFIAKTGDQAGSQLPSKAGEPTCLSSNAFFAGFTRPRNSDSSTNRSNINLYQRHPANPGAELQCDPTNPKTPVPCINEFYDERVYYDAYRQRFVIQAAARGGVFVEADKTPEQNARARRYFAIAVSRTEDPRDGFEQWITTENNYSDWPRIAGGDGVLVAAHAACKGSDTVCGKDETADLPLISRAQRPMAVVFNMDDMVAAKEQPRNWKIDPDDVGGGGTVIPLTHHGATNGWTYFIGQSREAGRSVTLYGFKQPVDWSKKPEIKHATTEVKGGTSGFGEAATYQNGKLYFAGADRIEQRVPNVAPARYMVRGVRIDVSTTGTGLALAKCPSQGCLVFSFGSHDMDDAPGDVLSYELPSMAVNKAGDMIVVHGRTPVRTAKPIGQEARYRIFYHDSRGLRDGAVLHAGSGVLTGKFCSKQGSDTTATPENYFHIQYGDATCPDQRHQDYATAVVDPNGTDFWLAHAFAIPAGYKMVAGKVTP